jgi:hypothetical protein
MALAVGRKLRGSELGLAGSEVTRTSSSGNITAETVVDTISVPVVSGRRYRIEWNGGAFSDNGTGYARVRLRETNVSGTLLKSGNVPTSWASGQAFPLHLVTFWTATSTATVTFVATLARIVGTGNVVAQAGTDNPTCFYVENSY